MVKYLFEFPCYFFISPRESVRIRKMEDNPPDCSLPSRIVPQISRPPSSVSRIDAGISLVGPPIMRLHSVTPNASTLINHTSLPPLPIRFPSSVTRVPANTNPPSRVGVRASPDSVTSDKLGSVRFG